MCTKFDNLRHTPNPLGLFHSYPARPWHWRTVFELATKNRENLVVFRGIRVNETKALASTLRLSIIHICNCPNPYVNKLRTSGLLWIFKAYFSSWNSFILCKNDLIFERISSVKFIRTWLPKSLIFTSCFAAKTFLTLTDSGSDFVIYQAILQQTVHFEMLAYYGTHLHFKLIFFV